MCYFYRLIKYELFADISKNIYGYFTLNIGVFSIYKSPFSYLSIPKRGIVLSTQNKLNLLHHIFSRLANISAQCSRWLKLVSEFSAVWAFGLNGSVA